MNMFVTKLKLAESIYWITYSTWPPQPTHVCKKKNELELIQIYRCWAKAWWLRVILYYYYLLLHLLRFHNNKTSINLHFTS